ncbi:hypothetical protein F2Q68_00028108 [Brassica cretica]|uniref:SGNH hydrolase-type esterase domain-containing protein n=1 Tax=Brassica cretica TaxID=69181 RepID=A0A8S9IGF4_BRACR|nr:hypothetical protein F2Q68_00028108 [Brassica cretica]
MRGRSNELCRPYAEALLNLCREINVKGIDLWNAIQQQDDWSNTCFTDGIHFTAEGRRDCREGDTEDSDLELTRNKKLEPPPGPGMARL